LIGDVVARGKSEEQVGTAIAEALRAQYLQAPEVIVTVASVVGRKATLAVRSPSLASTSCATVARPFSIS